MKSEEIKIKLDDSYINVIRFGKGDKNLIIISGVSLTGLEGQGEAIAEAYKTFNNDFTVYLFERKKDINKNYSIEDMAKDIITAMDKLGIDSAFLYGVSQGGMIALKLALSYPAKFKKIVLCSTLCRPTEKMKKVGEEWMKLSGQHNVRELNRSFFKNIYSPAFLERYKNILAESENVGEEKDCDRFYNLIKAIFDFNIYDKIEKINCPVLVIGDTNDKVTGIEGSYDIINKLNCKNVIFNKYSHAVYDEAEEVKTIVKNFMA